MSFHGTLHSLVHEAMQPDGQRLRILNIPHLSFAGGERVGISGYSPGWLDSGFAFWPYGDLVYAEFTPGGNEVVQFTIVDGVAAPVRTSAIRGNSLASITLAPRAAWSRSSRRSSPAAASSSPPPPSPDRSWRASASARLCA